MGGALSEPTKLKRDALPIPDITPVGLTTYDAKDRATSFPPIEQLRPPEGAPNVLIVLIDDVGSSRCDRHASLDRAGDRHRPADHGIVRAAMTATTISRSYDKLAP
jgi:hypothetical protein